MPTRIPPSLLLYGAACATMVVLGHVLHLVAPAPYPGSATEVTSLLPNTVGVFPEPQDPFLFVSLALAASLVLIGVFAVGVRSNRISVDPQPVFWSIVAIAFVVLIAERSYQDSGVWGAAIAGCIAATVFGLSVPPKLRIQSARIGFWLLFPAAAVLILSQRVWTTGSLVYSGPISSHYEAVTSSIVRIASGSTCLAEVLPQYGCYGEFLAPLLQIFGSTITVLTVIFAILLIAAVWASMAFSAAIVKHPVVLLGCSLCLVMAAGFNLRYDRIDPVLQYFPLRFLFPVLSLLLAMWFQRRASSRKAFVLGIAGGAGLAWNLESGVAVTISLGAFVTIGNFTAHPWRTRAGIAASLRQVLAYSFGVTAFVGTFVVYLVLKADGPVDLRNLIVFQQVFAMTGFGMIPIPAFPAYWTIHAALLFGTLFLAAVAASRPAENRDPALELAAFLAVLGIGLSAYYIGRSHVLVLRLVMWPSILLFFFLLDRTMTAAQGRLARTASAAAVTLAAVVPAAFFALAMPSVAGNMLRARAAPEEARRPVTDDIAFIRSKTSPGEPVGIVAVDQGVLYGHTATTAAIEGPGVAEMIRRVDLERLMEFLVSRGPEKLFIGTNLGSTAEKGMLGTSIPIDFDRLGTVYSSEPAPGGRLIYMQRR